MPVSTASDFKTAPGPLGAIAALANWRSKDFRYQALHCQTYTRSVLAAAVRLGIVGTYRAQRLQYDCGKDLDFVLDRCGGLREQDVAQSAPIIDILQSGHDRMYSRLFQS